MMVGEREGVKLGNAIFFDCITSDLEIVFGLSWETTDDVCSNRDLLTIRAIEVSDFCQNFIEFVRKVASVHEFEHLVGETLNRKVKMWNKPRIFDNFKKLISEILWIDTGNSDPWN